ncbi:fumarylacetoacetate hydrolase family protein [Catenulispora sp. NF23]|uniref:fumarylacetoacetate hydrolase family protein n=1 Tax=Catenulispora pinistramenti TaxID=2705254 RepID=UPI001BA7FE6D|nr:fumarylacetoacetate hydrolase family protein [Catenulispora pinistramenti]MBS2533204.1 fumarylacetoacetate hydrolase family protein [Catenulispora pinistramenti]
MRLLRLGEPGRERPVLLASDGRHFDLTGVISDVDRAFWADHGPEAIRAAAEAGTLPEIPAEEIAGLRVGAAVARPGKVVCIGLNYRDHAEETGAALPPRPVVFMKDPYTVVGPNDDILIPRASVKTDWEVELAVVIGERARYLDSHEAALGVIGGFAISNDVSEREFQLERSGQWDLGKSCETFNPLGPWLVTAEEAGDFQKLGLRLSVNGERRQNGNTENMIFGVAEVIHYLSQHMVLEPGDVINTGTPAGVALGMADHPYLRAGDVVELEIDGLGSQRSNLVQA